MEDGRENMCGELSLLSLAVFQSSVIAPTVRDMCINVLQNRHLFLNPQIFQTSASSLQMRTRK